ncbi:MAG: hypothetical protein ACOH1X_07100 [Kaistella sp.]
MNTFITELLEISKACNLTFDEVFIIAYDYGLVDSLANITAEFFENKKGSK